MRCSRCGAELRPDAAFCDRCGAPTTQGKPSRGRVAVVMVLAVALFVVLAMIGIRGLLGSGGGENAPDGSVTSAAGGAGTSFGASGASTGGATQTPFSTASLPAGATPCPESSASPNSLGAWSGTSRTSCGFALAVRDAYVATAPNGGEATVRAESPITHTTYTMTCTGSQPVTCKGGDDAVVYLAR